jgi:hypothetical protein
VPGAFILEHHIKDIKDDIVAAEPGAPRLGAPEAHSISSLLSVDKPARATVEVGLKTRFEVCVQRSMARIVARPQHDTFLYLLTSCGFQALVRPVESEIAGDVSVVIDLGNAYRTAFEKVTVETLGSPNCPIRFFTVLP